MDSSPVFIGGSGGCAFMQRTVSRPQKKKKQYTELSELEKSDAEEEDRGQVQTGIGVLSDAA
ncbi:hypothetical protein V7S43_012720 [Phytophthora oleae]|uniref:Uncharacterized protein n=1 Tax=Phytophthora oleae TaxID=2107226 RepID=A0ABD3F6N3_9STRA